MEHWPRGKILGGTSVLHSLVHMRGRIGDHQRWENVRSTESSGTVPNFATTPEARVQGLGLEGRPALLQANGDHPLDEHQARSLVHPVYPPMFVGREGAVGEWRGKEGPLKLTRVPQTEVGKAFLAAAAEFGFPINEELNGEMQDGATASLALSAWLGDPN